MDRKQIVQETTEIVKSILKHEDFILNDEKTAGEIKGWDSLTHMEIIVAIEKHFNLKFSFMEIMNFQNMGDMFDCILNKLEQ